VKTKTVTAKRMQNEHDNLSESLTGTEVVVVDGVTVVVVVGFPLFPVVLLAVEVPGVEAIPVVLLLTEFDAELEVEKLPDVLPEF